MIDIALYAYMRHLGYIGMFLKLIDAAVVYNHCWILSYFTSLTYLLVVLKRIHQEEKHYLKNLDRSTKNI